RYPDGIHEKYRMHPAGTNLRNRTRHCSFRSGMERIPAAGNLKIRRVRYRGHPGKDCTKNFKIKCKGEINMKNVELKGIITPILTPMKKDESVNLDELRVQIDRLIDGGVHGIFCFGTNGEGYILDENEKIQVLEATIDHVKGRVPVYAGSGCISTRDTIRM